MMEVLEISSYLLFQIFQLESVLSLLEIVWGSKILNSDFMSHFQPLNCEENCISRSEISSHTPSSCLDKDSLWLEQPTCSMLEGVNDIFIANQSFKRHIFDDGLPCAFFKSYSSPLQHWIELGYGRTCYYCSDFVLAAIFVM
jgi:hypothetical protein